MAFPKVSKTVKVESAAQFGQLLKTSKVVVTDFYADWCAPCKQIAPFFEKFSESLSRPNLVIFAKVDTEAHKDIASTYNVTALPTFIIFRDGKVLENIQGANLPKLSEVVKKLRQEVDPVSSGSGGAVWRGAELPRGYGDVTDQIEIRSSELLNVDSDFGDVRTLVDNSKPGALTGGKEKEAMEKDWVVTDTDAQLLLFTPFQSMIKLHTLQLTSIVDEDKEIMRPAVIKLFTNRPHNLGFEDAEGEVATQTIELTEKDFNAEGTANIPLRFVKFQNINSLVLFVESGLGSGEKTRVDRIRLIGETGEKREMGKLEKVGDDAGT